jgi:hypothetical protein
MLFTLNVNYAFSSCMLFCSSTGTETVILAGGLRFKFLG